MTGNPAIARRMPAKSTRCIGRIRASASRRPASSAARIMRRTARMRSSPKNMCSVRQRPMPSAPKARAPAASSGVSALARTPSRRRLSAQPMSRRYSSGSEGSTSATDPSSTSPLDPSIEIVSPRFTVTVSPPGVSTLKRSRA